jgi:hypothetical protein
MTFETFCLVLLAAAALHRVWNYEAVCSRLRAWADKIPYLRKPLLCPACNAFWFGLLAVVLWKFAPPAVLITAACLLPLRGLVWIYDNITAWTTLKPTQASVPPQAAPAQLPSPVSQAVASAVAAPVEAERTVVILTALGDFRSSYSIATAVRDQAMAIALARPTWAVQVWVMQNAQEQGWKDMPKNVTLRKIVPLMNWVENQAGTETDASTLRNVLLLELSRLKKPTIITHDLLFVSWYALFARALHMIGNLGNFTWFHVPHSLPSSRDGKMRFLTSLPQGNHFVAPVAEGYEEKFAYYYDTTVARIKHVPNIRDPRTWGQMTDRVRRLVTMTKLWEYDHVQILPVCTTRLEAKGFSKVIRTFAFLNEHTPSFLLVCNPNAGGPRSAGFIKGAKESAEKLGLSPDRWAFTSDLLPETTTYGLEDFEVKNLMQDYGNVFVFPSMAEADSLVAMEAKLSRQFTIMNEDVPTLASYADALVRFGTTPTVDSDVCRFAANMILDRPTLRKNMHRMVLKQRNLEGIGNQWAELVTGNDGVSG